MARGAIYTGSSQVLKLLIGFASIVVVARILTPVDYGIIAMTAPITGFIIIFQNLGLNQALIQAKELRDEQVNALFFCNLAASGLVALALLLIAPLVTLFYGDPRPGNVAAASAITVLLAGSTLQHTALLNRHMRYRALSFVEVAAAFTALVATIGFALWLRNYWALWLGTFFGTLVNAVLVWILDPWRPSRRIAWRSATDMLKFGAHLTGFNLLNFLNRNVDNVLIAKVWGAAAVGLYDRSYKLMMFPLQNINRPLGRVMLPAMARVQDQPERYRRMYVLAIRVLCVVSIPGIMAAAMCSERLVPFLLGDRWAAASPIFFWLSLAAIAQPISNATGWLFISSGRTRQMLQWALVSTPVTIVCFILGLPWGAEGVAAGYFASQVVRAPLLYFWSTRGSPVKAFDLYGALFPTLAGGALAWLIFLQIQHALSTVLQLTIAVLLSYAATLGLQALSRQGRSTLVEMVRLARLQMSKAHP